MQGNRGSSEPPRRSIARLLRRADAGLVVGRVTQVDVVRRAARLAGGHVAGVLAHGFPEGVLSLTLVETQEDHRWPRYE